MGSHKDSSDHPDPVPDPPLPAVPDLPTPSTRAGRAGLDALIADPGRALIALDFDGTLAPIVADPERARAHPGAVAALVALASRVASVAVITGRPAVVAVRRGGLAGVPGLERLVVLGHYGAERWDAATGAVTAPAPHPGVDAARAEIHGLVGSAEAARGTWIEDKGFAVAAHTRRARDPQAALDVLRAPLERLADRNGLVVEPGRMVLELRPPGTDKGVALRDHARAVGAAAVLYAGDDLGDLPAFAAVETLRAEGTPGLLVCGGSDEVPEVARRADIVVAGPGGVVALLRDLAARFA